MIREMHYSDMDAVNALSIDTFRSQYAVRNIDPIKRLKYMKIGYILEKVVSQLSGHKMFDFYVYIRRGALAGCIQIKKYSPEHYRIGVIEVDKKWRGKGIGTVLLEFSEKECRRRGGTSLTIETRIENTAALNLVRKFNFKEYGKYSMFILKSVPKYEKKELEGFRKLQLKDYEKIGQLDKKVRKKIFKIEGPRYHPTLSKKVVEMGRTFLFGEKFHEYVLEKEGDIAAYCKISCQVDNSTSLELLADDVSYLLLKDFVESILYYTAKEKMSAWIFKGCTVEKEVLTTLGFDEHYTFVALYKELAD